MTFSISKWYLLLPLRNERKSSTCYNSLCPADGHKELTLADRFMFVDELIVSTHYNSHINLLINYIFLSYNGVCYMRRGKTLGPPNLALYTLNIGKEKKRSLM